MIQKSIGILGAGWLGTALAFYLQDKGYSVNVSVRTEEKKTELENSGLQAYALKITEDQVLGDLDFFNQTDVLIICLTPQNIAVFKNIAAQITQHNIREVILCSSTGIYADCSGTVDENSTLNVQLPKVQLLKDIEAIFLQLPQTQTTVLRLGGLIGPQRHPVTFMAKKDFISEGNEPVNIVYQQTILQTVECLLNHELPNTIFNLTEDDHRTKKDFYTEAAQKRNLTLPEFQNSEHPKNRIVSSEKIKEYLEKR